MESDVGPTIEPDNGFRECFLDRAKNKHKEFFRAIFDERMFTVIADMTNMYPQKGIISK